jgi:peptidyl-prolyl cis-trans isomerase SDCCAG10
MVKLQLNLIKFTTICSEYLKLVKDKLSSKNRKDKDVKLKTKPEEPKEEYYLGKAEKESDKKHLEEIKKEIRDLKRSMKKGKEQEIDLAEEKKKQAEASQQQNEVIKEFLEEQKVYKERKKDTSKKGDDREAQTLALLQKFKSKISTAKETFGEANPEAIVEEEDVESENPKSIAW